MIKGVEEHPFYSQTSQFQIHCVQFACSRLSKQSDLFLKRPALRGVNRLNRVFRLASASREHSEPMFS